MDDGKMNAYELADYIQKNYATSSNDIKKIANMLRQQADRIKEMEQKCSAMREQLKYLESQIYGGTTK